MTTPTSDDNAISYKVGFPADTPEEDARRQAEVKLNESAERLGCTPIIETFEKVQTVDHEAAGEYLMVIRGRWATDVN